MEYWEAKDALEGEDFTYFGANIGKLAGDVFLKNGWDIAWQFNNSNALNDAVINEYPSVFKSDG